MRSSCTTTELFSVFPNPVHDKVFINIVASNDSEIRVQLFDNKGTLVKLQNGIVLKGSNQIGVDMNYFKSGVYNLSVSWNNGQMQKATQVVKL